MWPLGLQVTQQTRGGTENQDRCSCSFFQTRLLSASMSYRWPKEVAGTVHRLFHLISCSTYVSCWNISPVKIRALVLLYTAGEWLAHSRGSIRVEWMNEKIFWCSCCGSAVTNLTNIHEDVGSIPGLDQWVKDPALPYGVGHRCSLDLVLLWLRCCCGYDIGRQLQLWFNP